MRVLLVSCYELGHQPLAVASTAAHLIAAGITPDCVDLAVQSLPLDRLAEVQLVAISVPMHTAVRIGVDAATRVRSVNRRCHICFFGLYASLNADFLLREIADSVIGGEVEPPLVALAIALHNDDRRPVAGVHTRTHTSPPNLARVQHRLPARHLLPSLDAYAQLEWRGVRVPVGYLEASRGCAHHCLHCPITPIYQGAVRIVQRDVARADIRALVELGARHITFGDPDFLNGVRHSLAVARDLHRDFPDLTFDVTTRIEHLIEHRQLLPELSALGCLFVVSAVESLSEQVLLNLDKGHTRADVAEALRLCRQNGITLRPTLVPFTPWTTADDFIDLLTWIADEELIDTIDAVQLTIRLLVPPGSSLLQTEAMQAHLIRLDEANFTYVWRHPDPTLDRLQAELSVLVEERTTQGDSQESVFAALALRARAILGRELVSHSHARRSPLTRAAPPRLTEAWFC